MEIIDNFEEKVEKNDAFELERNQGKQKSNKKIIDFNVILIVFGLLMGFVITGSFGIDFFPKNKIMVSGEEVKAFEQNGKTWVAFNDPVVQVTIITDENCENCDYEEAVEMMKTTSIPTLNVNAVNFNTDEAKRLIEIFSIKSIPAFIFDSRLVEIKEYNQIKKAFISKDNNYYLNTAMIGIPAGRYLESFDIDENDISKGSENAKLTIVEFSDFECPFCAGEIDTVNQILEKYGDDIRLVYKHFPLSIHNDAEKAAEASECANDQKKFWEMHDVMFADQSKLSIKNLKQTAKDIGLNTNDFNKCLDSGKYQEKIEDDIRIGTEYGISGIPAFFIEDEFLSGAQPFEEFEKIIDKKLLN